MAKLTAQYLNFDPLLYTKELRVRKGSKKVESTYPLIKLRKVKKCL